MESSNEEVEKLTRDVAITILKAMKPTPCRADGKSTTHILQTIALEMAIKALEQQPEIIRCNQCKYAEVADPEDCQDGYTCQYHRGSIWFSGSYCSWAESEGKK